MKVAILGAMREEIEPILRDRSYKTSRYANNNFYEFKLGDNEIVLAHSKIGKVNSALTASALIERFGAKALIFTGVAGALSDDLKIADLGLATDLVQADVDITAFGHAPGFIPDTEHFIKSTAWLNALAHEAASELDLELKPIRIATLDTFVHQKEQREGLKNTYQANAVEMEGASVALVCHSHQIPFMVLRAISDEASGKATEDFDEFLHKSSEISAKLALKIAQNIAQITLSKHLIKDCSKALREFEMIKDNDHVLVALSGGKDSLALLHLIDRFSKIAPLKFSYEAATLSYGMGEDYEALKAHCKKHKIKHSVIDSSILEIADEKIRQNSSFCSFFSRMRRGFLYTYAQKKGANVLALGHHLDDACESFFMNFMHNGSLRSMAPKYTAKCGVRVIRPLIFVRERVLIDNAIRNHLNPIGDEACPALKYPVKYPHARAQAKELLARLEREQPKLFTSLKAAFSHIHKNSFFEKISEKE